MITLKINNKEITVSDGTLILDAAKEAGFDIPTFCYQARLSGLGSCRMCLIEIEGQKKLQPACITPVMPGVNILTESSSISSMRSAMLEMLLSNHALDCPVCDKAGECELQDMVHKHGPRNGRFDEVKIRFHEKDYAISPVIVKNSNRCVQCTRCVRVCREIVGRGVLGVMGRGAHQEETSFRKTELDCDHCGMCIEVCPVGCFMRRPYRYKARPWDLKSSDTVCPYCATGCRITVQSRNGEVVRSIARNSNGFNANMLCARGRFGYDITNSADRLRTPLLRGNNGFEAISWERAIEIVKQALMRPAPEKVGGVASARLTNEELYLFQKFMRKVVKTPNVDSSSRWDAATVASFISATGMAEGPMTAYECMESDMTFIVGSQISDENPVTDYIVRYVSAAARKAVVIASPRAMKLDSSAHLRLRHLPGRLGSLLLAIVSSLHKDNSAKLAGVKGIEAINTASFEELLKSCGAEASDIDALVGRFKRAETISIMAGTDFLRYKEGSFALGLLISSLKAFGKKVRVLPLLDRSNQRGAWDMGVSPGFGPGYGAVLPGLSCEEMLEKAAAGEMDALYVVGEDIAAMYPDEAFAKAALSKVKFLAVQAGFMTETAKLAHLVLPSAVFVERSGTMTNQEGRIQSVYPLVNAPGEAKTDFDIIASLFDATASIGASSSADVFEEIKKEVSSYAGAEMSSSGALASMPTNAPHGYPGAKGVMVKASVPPFFKGGSGGISDKRLAFAGDKPEPGVPFKTGDVNSYILVTGNHLYHSGRLSSRSTILSGLLKEPIVEISKLRADGLGLSDGALVVVSGNGFSAKFALRVKKDSISDVCFIPENFVGATVNRFFKKGELIPTVNIAAFKG
ncbi:MAG: NADH-quinone oxidoreductase subunit NuoG [Thermodesulfobacteriota bacterium]